MSNLTPMNSYLVDKNIGRIRPEDQAKYEIRLAKEAQNSSMDNSTADSDAPESSTSSVHQPGNKRSMRTAIKEKVASTTRWFFAMDSGSRKDQLQGNATTREKTGITRKLPSSFDSFITINPGADRFVLGDASQRQASCSSAEGQSRLTNDKQQINEATDQSTTVVGFNSARALMSGGLDADDIASSAENSFANSLAHDHVIDQSEARFSTSDIIDVAQGTGPTHTSNGESSEQTRVYAMSEASSSTSSLITPVGVTIPTRESKGKNKEVLVGDSSNVRTSTSSMINEATSASIADSFKQILVGDKSKVRLSTSNSTHPAKLISFTQGYNGESSNQIIITEDTSAFRPSTSSAVDRSHLSVASKDSISESSKASSIDTSLSSPIQNAPDPDGVDRIDWAPDAVAGKSSIISIRSVRSFVRRQSLEKKMGLLENIVNDFIDRIPHLGSGQFDWLKEADKACGGAPHALAKIILTKIYREHFDTAYKGGELTDKIDQMETINKLKSDLRDTKDQLKFARAYMGIVETSKLELDAQTKNDLREQTSIANRATMENRALYEENQELSRDLQETSHHLDNLRQTFRETFNHKQQMHRDMQDSYMELAHERMKYDTLMEAKVVVERSANSLKETNAQLQKERDFYRRFHQQHAAIYQECIVNTDVPEMFLRLEASYEEFFGKSKDARVAQGLTLSRPSTGDVQEVEIGGGGAMKQASAALREKYIIAQENDQPLKTMAGPEFVNWANTEFKSVNPYTDEDVFAKARISDDVFADFSAIAPAASGAYKLHRRLSLDDVFAGVSDSDNGSISEVDSFRGLRRSVSLSKFPMPPTGPSSA